MINIVRRAWRKNEFKLDENNTSRKIFGRGNYRFIGLKDEDEKNYKGMRIGPKKKTKEDIFQDHWEFNKCKVCEKEHGNINRINKESEEFCSVIEGKIFFLFGIPIKRKINNENFYCKEHIPFTIKNAINQSENMENI